MKFLWLTLLVIISQSTGTTVAGVQTAIQFSQNKPFHRLSVCPVRGSDVTETMLNQEELL
jgi:hypothetical protein